VGRKRTKQREPAINGIFVFGDSRSLSADADEKKYEGKRGRDEEIKSIPAPEGEENGGEKGVSRKAIEIMRKKT